jgi:hypothetical protein
MNQIKTNKQSSIHQPFGESKFLRCIFFENVANNAVLYLNKLVAMEKYIFKLSLGKKHDRTETLVTNVIYKLYFCAFGDKRSLNFFITCPFWNFLLSQPP